LRWCALATQVAAACRLGKLGCRLDPRNCFLRGCWRCCAQWVTGSVRCAQRPLSVSRDRSSWEPGFQVRSAWPARRDSRVHQPPTGPKSPPHPPRAQAGCPARGPRADRRSGVMPPRSPRPRHLQPTRLTRRLLLEAKCGAPFGGLLGRLAERPSPQSRHWQQNRGPSAGPGSGYLTAFDSAPAQALSIRWHDDRVLMAGRGSHGQQAPSGT
jgi:hypothetical protein